MLDEKQTPENEKPSFLEDYGRSGPHFITIVTYQERCWFETRRFLRIGRDAWKDLPKAVPTVRLDAFVLMPNHVHFIIWLYQGLDMFGDQASASRTDRDLYAPDLAEVVRAYKDVVEEKIQRWGGAGFAWQRGFYDHPISNREELLSVRQVIRDDPDNWDSDPNNPYAVD